MDMLQSYDVRQWAGEFLIVLFLLGGVLVFAVGVGLMVWNQGIQRVSAALNRWISTRRLSKSMDIPRDTSLLVYRYRRWIAAFFLVGACYSLFGLTNWFNEHALIVLLGLKMFGPQFAGWFADFVRWTLLVGNAVAIVAAAMLVFFPNQLAALEVKGARWISDRTLLKSADDMKVPLDNWVAAHPKSTGVVIAIVGLLMVGDFSVMWTKLG